MSVVDAAGHGTGVTASLAHMDDIQPCVFTLSPVAVVAGAPSNASAPVDGADTVFVRGGVTYMAAGAATVEGTRECVCVCVYVCGCACVDVCVHV